MTGLRTLACITALALAGPAAAQTVASLDANADEVFLRMDCTGYANCVEDDLNGLNNWIWNTRAPSASAPLIVTLGPGDFSGSIDCPNGAPVASGHTTFRGAGRQHSRIVADSKNRGIFPPVIGVFSVTCTDLAFRDLGISAATGAGIGAYFVEGGKTTWTNVDIDANQTAWYEICFSGEPTDPPVGQHYIFGSRLVSRGYGYLNTCDDSWLYGTDVLVELNDTALAQNQGRGIVIGSRGVVRIFGSSVRVRRLDATSVQGDQLVGVLAAGEGEFHMHGGIINVDATGLANADAVALQTTAAGGRTHVVDTAFALTAGSGGTIVRTLGPGQLQSPFLWPSGAAPPGGAADLGSLTGKDLFVETDCASGGCNAAGTDPHLMIYKADCPNSPWFDVVRGVCRD